jgi:ribosomal protein S18 acetylase RimI-like enzyme
MIFRRPAPDEAEAMAALHVQCWREAYTAIVPQDVAATFDAGRMVERWREHIENLDRFLVAAFDDGIPAGFINQGRSVEKIFPEMDGHIAAIYVLQSHYRQGIGRKLIGMAAQDWQSKGGHSIALGVLSENVRARSFYESLGAKFVRDGNFEWAGHQLPDCIYVFEDLPALIP